jgi:hypothetical protein
MSLKSKFKVNTSLASDGAWFTLCTNSDGSVCRVKLRRTGQSNPKWPLAFRTRGEGKDLDSLTPDEDREFMAYVFSDAVVAGWENMQPDDDGKNWPCDEEHVVKLLGNPEWLDLRNDWRGKADSLAPFQDPREGEVKN